jgi:hypothetical protein
VVPLLFGDTGLESAAEGGSTCVVDPDGWIGDWIRGVEVVTLLT